MTASSIGEALGKDTLDLNLAAFMIAKAAGMGGERQAAVQTLEERGWIREETISKIADHERLTNGDAFMLIRDVVEYGAGVVFE